MKQKNTNQIFQVFKSINEFFPVVWNLFDKRVALQVKNCQVWKFFQDFC